MQKRFTALRIVGTIYKIVAVLILIGGVLSLIGFPLAFSSRPLWSSFGVPQIADAIGAAGGLAVGFAGFLGMLLAAVFIYAIGDVFSLLIAIEENTRAEVILTQGVRQQP